MGNSPASSAQPIEQDAEASVSVSVVASSGHKKKPSCCANLVCLKIIYVIIAIIIKLAAISLIVVAVCTAIATKIYSTDISGRLVAMIILAVSAAVTLSVVIYATIAVFRKKVKPLHATTVALVILAIIQAVIAGMSVRVTQDDELSLSRSLIESFRMSREDNPRHMNIWATTQNDLLCCGVYSPEDYRLPGVPQFFTPDIPISCCPSYDPDRSELVQERARDVCKSRREFYQVGCKSHILQVFKDTSSWVLGVTILLIVLEVIEVFVGSILSRKCKRSQRRNSEEGTTEENVKNNNPDK